jgi:hypothetical protein
MTDLIQNIVIGALACFVIGLLVASLNRKDEIVVWRRALDTLRERFNDHQSRPAAEVRAWLGLNHDYVTGSQMSRWLNSFDTDLVDRISRALAITLADGYGLHPLSEHRMSTADTLSAYSEWLDTQKVMKKPSRADTRSHDDLVAAFIEHWRGGDDAPCTTRAKLAGES